MNEKRTHIDLFSGIGAWSIAAERTGNFQTVGFAEFAEYPSAVLKRHWPHVPNFGDIRKVTFKKTGICDLLTASPPCQPYSRSNNNRGDESDHRILWRQLRRLGSSRSFTSTIFSMRWSPQGTPRGRLYFQLVPTEVAPTEGTDSGSWPTPTSRDGKDTGSLENVPEKGLLGRVFQNIFGMKLPPEFSEWLMGLPLGHTVVNGFKPLETQSPRPSRTKS